jgi:hypothetical protein
VIQLLPASVFAKDSAEDSAEDLLTPAATELVAEQADSVEVLGEDLSKRDEFYKEFILDNGLRLATIYPTAVHYEQDGQWADIDNTLTVKAVRGQVVYTNTAGPWQVQFPRQLSGSNAISLTKDGYTVSFAMAGELRTGSGLAIASANQTVTLANTSAARVQKVDVSALKAEAEFEETILDKLYARVQYDAVYAGTNVVYDLDGGRLKESIVLRSYDAALQGYRYELDTGGLIPVLKEDQRLSNEIQVFDFGGNDDLTTFLMNLMNMDKFDQVKSLAVIRDAERDVAKACKEVGRAFNKCGFKASECCGTWTQNDTGLKVGFMLFPLNNNAGTLEDLCLQILSENNNETILSSIDEFLSTMESSHGRRYRRKHKNKLHTYLSSTDEYVTMPLGLAAKSGAFDWGSSELEPLKNFLIEGFDT